MGNVVFETIAGGIEVCRDLCNELMALQKSKAVMSPELFDGMNFETRMKPAYEKSALSRVTVVKDGGAPVGYVFSTVEDTDGGDKSRDAIPDWAPKTGTAKVMGFYPDWPELPQRVGCLNHFYLRESYRGRGLGKMMLDDALRWLWSIPGIEITFVYISNGNTDALDFYLKNGFVFSHDVFGGFIKAAYMCKGKN